MTVRPRGKTWQADLTYQGHRYRASFTSRNAAEKWEADARITLAKGRPLLPPVNNPDVATDNWTLAVAIDRTNERFWKGSPGGKTAMHNAKSLLSFFGQRHPLSSINAEAIDDFIAHLEALGNSNATINRKLAALSKIMSFAVSRGRLAAKPAIERKREPRGRIRYLSDQEEDEMLRLLELWGRLDHQDAFIILIDTGIRMGELFRIEARDIDFKLNKLSLWKTKGDLPRTLVMTKRVRGVLERRIKRFPARVFPYDHPWFRHTWDRIRSHMGLTDDKQFVPHALRHTTASRLVQRGVAIAVVQAWMGHKTISVTLRYAHLSPRNLVEAAHALEQDR